MSNSETQSKTILIADNSPLNRLQIGGILASDYNILEAEDGVSALQIMREEGADNIACVLLDLYMPGTTGFDVLAEKKDDPSIADIPVIIVTADSVTAAEVQALDLGASDFLTKPIEPEIMKRRIRSVVYAREAEEQRTHIRMLEEAAWHSDHDDLTGIFTRKAFLRETRQMLEDDPGENYSLVVFDFDNFKLINELAGSKRGDEVLKVAAEALTKVVSGLGTFGRLGNDYFAFCVPQGGLDIEQTLAFISAAMQDYFTEINIGINLVIAAGVYDIEDRDVKISVILDRALMAQYTIKGSYDEHIAFYNSVLSERLIEEQDIVNNMEAALDRGEFQVVLQPVYDLTTGRPASAEALVRWQRPGYGTISPSMFIPLFEKNGFISKMDFNVWEQVCKLIAERREKGLPDIPISVNLSRRSVYNAAIADTIIALTEKYDIDPHLFRIEVTESSFVDDSDRIIDMVKDLQDHGFTILMDDFGSGYSSFNALKDIPVDILKADMMFMRDFEQGGRIVSIFNAIVRMARWLGIPVIAEGVETIEQADFLRSIGCRYSQGYYFARPMPPEEFEEHLIEHPVKELAETANNFSREDVEAILGGDHLLDTILSSMLKGFAVLEWGDSGPEVVRTNKGFREAFAFLGEDTRLEAVLENDLLGSEATELIIDSCRNAIDTHKSVDLTLDFEASQGKNLHFDITIVNITSIETDAMLFIGLRK